MFEKKGEGFFVKNTKTLEQDKKKETKLEELERRIKSLEDKLKQK